MCFWANTVCFFLPNKGKGQTVLIKVTFATEECGSHEQFSDCGTACEATCSTGPGPRPCIKICKQGCFCQTGYIRLIDGGPCISESSCPGECVCVCACVCVCVIPKKWWQRQELKFHARKVLCVGLLWGWGHLLDNLAFEEGQFTDVCQGWMGCHLIKFLWAMSFVKFLLWLNFVVDVLHSK